MGNVHEVMQIEPWESGVGAAIAIEATRVGAVRKTVEGANVSYVRVVARRRFVETPRGEVELSGPKRWFVEIQTGGKWGYGDELEELLQKLAPSLGRAVFYVQDEAAQAVIEYVLDGSELSVRHVENNSHVGLVLLRERSAHAAFARRELSDMLDDMMFLSEPDEESVRAKAVRALESETPDAWDTWWHRGTLLLDRARHDEAATAFRRAAKLAPSERALDVRVSLLRALAVADPEAALAEGPALARELEAAPDAMFSDHGEAFEVLAELERARGNVGRFRELSFAALRKAKVAYREVLALAKVLEQSGDVEGARDLALVAAGLRPELEAEARAITERAST